MPARRRWRWWKVGALSVLGFIVFGCGGKSPSGIGPAPLPRPGTRAPDVQDVARPPEVPKRGHSVLVGDRMADMVPQVANRTIPQLPSPFRFTDITNSSGIDFAHVSGMGDSRHFPTANGSGVAILDYDCDGTMDLYFASCNPIPPGLPQTGRNRLYRGRGDGSYVDVTDAAGVGFAGFCHGIVVGDIDNDGDPDLVLCNYGPNVLYLNNGDGTFRDISEKSGLKRPGWSSGGAFLDHDNDGDLDIYISNYGEWRYPEDDIFCGNKETGVPLYCSPRVVRTVQHFFYRNNGDLTFTDVTEQVGVARAEGQRGHGFGVVTADLDGDGLIDIYVANDMNPNFLFLNKGDGTFHDATEESGAAYDDKGQAQSGMGVDAEDIDGDGLPELFVTNFANEYNTLYQNLGSAAFLDQTSLIGLGADAMPWVGWGCALGDFDNDGWPDAFVTNGHVDNNRENTPYEEPPLLHRNVPLGTGPDAGRRFKISTRDVGPYFASSHVGRGAAFGDLDNDGDLDIVINHKDGPPALLRNDTPSAQAENHWVRLELVGTRSNRDGIGARIEVKVGDRTIHRQRKGNYSMLSANDPRMLIGTGGEAEAESIVVRWPRGAVSTLEHVKTGMTTRIVEPEEEKAVASAED